MSNSFLYSRLRDSWLRLGILVGCDRFFPKLLPCDRVSVLAGVGGDRFFPNLLPCDRVPSLAGVGGDRFFPKLLLCDRALTSTSPNLCLSPVFLKLCEQMSHFLVCQHVKEVSQKFVIVVTHNNEK